MAKKLPLVEVTWVDSTSYTRWTTRDGALGMPLIVITTAGYLLDKTRKEVRLVRSMAADDDVGDVFLIPRSCIFKIKKK